MGGAAAALLNADPLEAVEELSAIRAELHPARTAPERLGQHWHDLVGAASEPNVFGQPWFAAASFRNLELARDLRMLEVWEGGLLLGLLPLFISGFYGRMPVLHVENWLHPHSFLGTPLVRKGREEAFWKAVLTRLDQEPWARSFLHMCKMVEGGPVLAGLSSAARALGRPCDVVYRFERAMLETDLAPEAYYETTVRKKKRKELKRLANRLAELGEVQTHWLGSREELHSWCDAFLALEAAGWKGEAGSALASDPATDRFFREAVQSAFDAGQLDFLRLDLDGRPLAMLVNFLAAPGSFSFKIAFDEEHARFSPGVLIQIDNLRVLAREDIGWMDSCAVEDHPMINSFWGERRRLVRVSVPLRGPLRRLTFRMCRMAEDASAAFRRLKKPARLDEKGPDDE